MQSKTTSIFLPKAHFGFLANRVGRLMSNQTKAYLKSKGFSFPTSCMGILADLWESDGKTQKELGLSVIKTKSSITKMLMQLESAGLIYKVENAADKRNKLIFLTPEGQNFKTEVVSLSQKLENLIKTQHSEGEMKIAKDVLRSIYDLLLENS